MVTVISSAMRSVDDVGDPVVDLLAGFVVAAAEAVADAGEGVFGVGQGALAGVGDRGGLLGGPDVGDAQAVGGAGVAVVVGERAAGLSTRCARSSGRRRCALRAVVEPGQRGQPAGHVGGEPLAPSRCRRAAAPRTATRRRRRHTACPGARARSRQRRPRRAGRARGCARAHRRSTGLVGAPRMRAVVDRDPGAGGRLHGLDLAGDGAVGGPPLATSADPA